MTAARDLPAALSPEQRATLFAAWSKDMQPTALAAAIRQQCEQGDGFWLAPDVTPGVTHLFEISLFGTVAYGTTLEQAALHWRAIVQLRHTNQSRRWA